MRFQYIIFKCLTCYFILLAKIISFCNCLDPGVIIPKELTYDALHSTAPTFALYTTYQNELKQEKGFEFLRYVNPFFGTDRGGNRFPGTLYPFGMVKLGGDFRNSMNYQTTDSYAGYQRDGYLRQVSMVHVSGTGGAPTYGVIGQLPVIIDDFLEEENENGDTKERDSSRLNSFNIGHGIERKIPDSSHIGYYKIELKNDVNIEFTSGKKSGIIRYTLTPSVLDKRDVDVRTSENNFFIYVNLKEYLKSFNRPWWSQQFEFGKMFINEHKNSYEGKVIIKNGWSSTDSYSIYFYGVFNHPFISYYNVQKNLKKRQKFKFSFGDKKENRLATLFQFDKDLLMEEPLLSKIGISYHSIHQAKLNCKKDFQKSWDFDEFVYKNIDEWKTTVFDKIKYVKSLDSEVLDKFYNSLYGSHLMPTDKSGIESPFFHIDPPNLSMLELNDINERGIPIDQVENTNEVSTLWTTKNEYLNNLNIKLEFVYQFKDSLKQMFSAPKKRELPVEAEFLFRKKKTKQKEKEKENLEEKPAYEFNVLGQEPMCKKVETPSSKTPYYDDWFTLWDTYRTLHPLLFIIQPEKSRDMINSLTLISEYEMFPPDGRSGSRSGRTQGGSNCDILFSEAIKKGIVYKKNEKCSLYKSSWRNANIVPPFILDERAPDSTNKFGRGALQDWVELGYVSTDYSRSLTRTVEYSNNDFSVSLMAQELGEEKHLVMSYFNRSKNWMNLWNEELELKMYEYKGFLTPKYGTGTRGKYRLKVRKSDDPDKVSDNKEKTNEVLEGKFIEDYNPADCGGCYWKDHTYEATSIEYMFSLSHDIHRLINLVGEKEFEERLDDLYNLYCSPSKALDSGLKYKYKSLSGKRCGFADVSNEPSFGAGYLYNYINKHDKTSETVNFLTVVEFTTGTRGLPGNSDSGAMESWLWFGLIGLYPVTGTDIYLIGSPQIEYLNINDELIIETIDLDPDEETGVRKNIYIDHVELNGKIIDRTYLKHSEIFSNGLLNINIGKKPSTNTLTFYMRHDGIHWDKDFKQIPTSKDILMGNY